jgi:hypothetical protein
LPNQKEITYQQKITPSAQTLLIHYNYQRIVWINKNMINKNKILNFALVALLTSLLIIPSYGWSHGWAGKRFFPSTLATEDPFVNDELSFVLGHIRAPDEDGAVNHTTNIEAEYTKTIFPKFGISLGGNYNWVDPVNGDPNHSGFSNMEVGAKYQFFTSDKYESLLSLGLGASIGDTGNPNVPEADSFSTVAPGIFFGQGFGFLPKNLKYLRPFAITGLLQANVPTRGHSIEDDEIIPNSNTLTWGGAIEYSIPYLQTFIKDVGIPAPFNRIIPLVEVSASSCIDRACSGTTGTINPGVIWVGDYVQFGLEATIPFNNATGNDVGVLAQFHIYVDDVAPKTFGRPLFGN